MVWIEIILKAFKIYVMENEQSYKNEFESITKTISLLNEEIKEENIKFQK